MQYLRIGQSESITSKITQLKKNQALVRNTMVDFTKNTFYMKTLILAQLLANFFHSNTSQTEGDERNIDMLVTEVYVNSRIKKTDPIQFTFSSYTTNKIFH
jgi:hypothetical protein